MRFLKKVSDIVRRLHVRAAAPTVGILRIASNVADGETITVGTTVFEVDTNAAITAGRVAVDCSGGVTPTLFGTAFVAAFNAQNLGLLAVKISANVVVIYDNTPGGGATLATTETLAGANNGWGAATLVKVGVPQDEFSTVIQSRAANAVEEAAEVMVFGFPFAPTAYTVDVRTAAGVARAWDGAVTVSGNLLVLTSSGTTDIVNTNVVTVVAR